MVGGAERSCNKLGLVRLGCYIGTARGNSDRGVVEAALRRWPDNLTAPTDKRVLVAASLSRDNGVRSPRFLPETTPRSIHAVSIKRLRIFIIALRHCYLGSFGSAIPIMRTMDVVTNLVIDA